MNRLYIILSNLDIPIFGRFLIIAYRPSSITFNNRVIIKGKHNFKGFITGYLTFFILKIEIFDILTKLLHKTFYDESYKASPQRKGDQAKMAR